MRTSAAGQALRPLLFPSLVLLALACKDSTSVEPPPVSPPGQPLAINTPALQTLQVPRTVQLSTQGGSAHGTVSWESSDPVVASVSASGLVSTRFPGSVTITARQGPWSATVILHVEATWIEVGPSPAIVALDGTRQLTATAHDANGAVLNGVAVRWTTGNASIATVAPTGVVTGLGKGITTITATGGGATGGVLVYVNPTFGARIVFSSIGTTAAHACGLEAQTGLAYCWGDNHAGALGSGADGEFPALVSGARRFGSISVGNYASCAIEVPTGSAYCWGSNANGELGDGTRTTRTEPTLVAGGRIRFSSISAGGDVTCGIEAQTDLGYCWGAGGVIGDGTLLQRSTPTLIASGSLRFSNISASDSHACGIEAQTDHLYCWGNNDFGQIGDGTKTSRRVPTLVGSGIRFSSISSDYRTTCGIEALTGLAYCWGHNTVGQVGDGTTIERLVPTLVGVGSRRFTSIDAGGHVSCGIEAQTGAGYCWGRNDLGQVGDGTTTGRLMPTLVGGGNPRFSSISAALCCVTHGVEAHTGLVYRWGYTTLAPTLLPAPLAPAPATPSAMPAPGKIEGLFQSNRGFDWRVRAGAAPNRPTASARPDRG